MPWSLELLEVMMQLDPAQGSHRPENGASGLRCHDTNIGYDTRQRKQATVRVPPWMHRVGDDPDRVPNRDFLNGDVLAITFSWDTDRRSLRSSIQMRDLYGEKDGVITTMQARRIDPGGSASTRTVEAIGDAGSECFRLQGDTPLSSYRRRRSLSLFRKAGAG